MVIGQAADNRDTKSSDTRANASIAM